MAFNKKLFAMLIDKARGDRSLRRFALDCEISYVQMRKLAACQQENPPRIKLIKKIAKNAQNDIAEEDLMFCAGISFETNEKKLPVSSVSIKQGELFYEKYLSLSMGQRRMICDFIDFLTERR
ncbi:MAG: hypothetical protein IJV00_06105 [Clostridia bacterium]|nr:hypothetical protein [Clostridia bacterium]